MRDHVKIAQETHTTEMRRIKNRNQELAKLNNKKTQTIKTITKKLEEKEEELFTANITLTSSQQSYTELLCGDITDEMDLFEDETNTEEKPTIDTQTD